MSEIRNEFYKCVTRLVLAQYYTATRKLFKYIDPYNDPTLIPVQTAMYCINK